jgi:hypothetical protein
VAENYHEIKTRCTDRRLRSTIKKTITGERNFQLTVIVKRSDGWKPPSGTSGVFPPEKSGVRTLRSYDLLEKYTFSQRTWEKKSIRTTLTKGKRNFY